jgi:lipopolysaccharide/colanic/teichoic acid biosynthesis glycosyltransferase
VALDSEYVRRQSLGFDIQILFLTAWKVIMRRDVTH